MKTTKNIKKTGLVCCIGFALTACSDFLNILPLNDIVLENYWTEEADVENAVTGCYAALETSDCIARMAIWGELRSDNIIAGMSTPDAENQLLKGNLLPSSVYTTWTCFYQVINRCNTILYYAPLVQDTDPNYMESELNATIAEVTAIRDLCYFYLIRTFCDVPFVTEPSIDDDQDYQIAASSFDTILTTLISDLEIVKDDAVKKYADETCNTGRITRYSIYAILADMYLWKQDYDNCIKYCDLVIDYKTEAYEENKSTNGNKVKLYGIYPLINEQAGGNFSGFAYGEIFGTGDSFESVFELHFKDNQAVTNSFVQNFYGSSSINIGYFSAADFLYKDIMTDENVVFTKTDCRYLESMEEASGMYAIDKYTRLSVSFTSSTSTSTTAPEVSSVRRSTNYANWIIYRLTDVMLMKAEAEVEKAGEVDANTVDSEQEACYRSAFSLVSAVYNRANNLSSTSSDTLIYTDYAISRTTMEELVLLERQRELLFEGKRWFDLVRLARREGSNTRLINHAINKYSENQSAIRKKLNSPYTLYFPYNEGELTVNPYLTQNPAYNTESSSSISE